jgi:hypothetical protein
MLRVEVEAGAGDLGRDQGIDDDEPAVALDQGHVRDVEPAHLVDAVGNLEEAVAQIEPRLTPEAWIDGRRSLGVGEEGVVAQCPHDAPGVVLDLDLGQRADEPAPGVVEIPGVGERQRVEHCAVERAGDRGGVFRVLGGGGHRRGRWYPESGTIHGEGPPCPTPRPGPRSTSFAGSTRRSIATMSTA